MAKKRTKKSEETTTSIGTTDTLPPPSNSEDEPRIPSVLPVLPLRQVVAFPGTVMPIGVGRPSSRQLLDESLPESKMIALITQRDEVDELGQCRREGRDRDGCDGPTADATAG